MSEICCRCNLAPPADAGLTHVQTFVSAGPTVGLTVCPDCANEMQGLPPPQRKRYGPGNHQFHVCGICRHALRSGEEPKCMRLHPDDIEGTEVERPGMYASCADCVRRFTPVIFARLKEQGHLQHPAQLTEGWLG